MDRYLGQAGWPLAVRGDARFQGGSEVGAGPDPRRFPKNLPAAARPRLTQPACRGVWLSRIGRRLKSAAGSLIPRCAQAALSPRPQAQQDRPVPDAPVVAAPGRFRVVAGGNARGTVTPKVGASHCVPTPATFMRSGIHQMDGGFMRTTRERHANRLNSLADAGAGRLSKSTAPALCQC